MIYRIQCEQRRKEFPLFWGLLPTRFVCEKSEANAIFISYKRWLEDMGYKRIRAKQTKHLDEYVYLELVTNINNRKIYYYVKKN